MSKPLSVCDASRCDEGGIAQLLNAIADLGRRPIAHHTVAFDMASAFLRRVGYQPVGIPVRPLPGNGPLLMPLCRPVPSTAVVLRPCAPGAAASDPGRGRAPDTDLRQPRPTPVIVPFGEQ